jgi:transcriptional regulator with XRE-family HTH domain
MPQVETQLKRNIEDAGLSFKEVAEQVGKSYSTLVQYLNGFSSMPGEIRLKIRRLIDAKKAEVEKNER